MDRTKVGKWGPLGETRLEEEAGVLIGSERETYMRGAKLPCDDRLRQSGIGESEVAGPAKLGHTLHPISG